MKKISLIITFLLFLTFVLAFGKTPVYPPDVEATLKAAGYNRGQIEMALNHYSAPGDSLKLKAAYFLIGNMEGHCYVTYSLQDTAKKAIPFDPLQFPTYDSLTAAFSDMEKEYGALDFKKKDVTDDNRIITADFLIKQIDYTFRAWHEKPWAKFLTFDQLCQYILPYRGSNEPLEDWRKLFWDKYADIESKMTNPSDPIEAARLINDDIKSWFGFDPRYYYHPTDQGMAEMIAKGKGRCEDMTNLTIYAMRANGLAVTSDYTPFWANSGNNHAWNAILTPNGKVIPFMGAESNPGDYHLANKLAKVYRKTFDIRHENLVFQKKKQEKVPGWLAGKSYVDVTADYVPVCDVTVKLIPTIPDSVDIAYLCVFNSGEWQPIHWGRITDTAATFTAMGTGIMYLPALYINEKVAPCGAPFMLHDDGSMTKYETGQDSVTAPLISTTRVQQVVSTDGVAHTALTSGKEYELSYWKEGWQSLGKFVASDTVVVSKTVPAGGLYWLVAQDSDHEERIFTIEDCRQVWW